MNFTWKGKPCGSFNFARWRTSPLAFLIRKAKGRGLTVTLEVTGKHAETFFFPWTGKDFELSKPVRRTLATREKLPAVAGLVDFTKGETSFFTLTGKVTKVRAGHLKNGVEFNARFSSVGVEKAWTLQMDDFPLPKGSDKAFAGSAHFAVPSDAGSVKGRWKGSGGSKASTGGPIAKRFKLELDFEGADEPWGRFRFSGKDIHDFPFFAAWWQLTGGATSVRANWSVRVRLELTGFPNAGAEFFSALGGHRSFDRSTTSKARFLPRPAALERFLSIETQPPSRLPDVFPQTEGPRPSIIIKSRVQHGNIVVPRPSTPKRPKSPVKKRIMPSTPKWLAAPPKKTPMTGQRLPKKGPTTGKKASAPPRPLSRRELLRSATRRTGFRADTTPTGQPVDCSVFAPNRVARKASGLLQVFIHAPRDRAKAGAEAQRFDPAATERGHRSLVLAAPVGTVFAFDVELEGLVVNERRDELIWNGEPQAATFRFEVPKDCPLGQRVGTVRVSKDGVPVGRIVFQIEVARDAIGASQRPAGDEARTYRHCFCSYASPDRTEMLKRAQGLRAAGLETFIDVMSLRPGDRWNPKIFQAIDECDLFVVIWSENANRSKWVNKEASYALKIASRGRKLDFRPIPIEGPPIAPVPKRLSAYHFNDELLSMIRASELKLETRAEGGGTAR